MNTKQQNKLAMYVAVKSVFDANNSVWQSLQAFADGYTDFTSHVTRIQTLELPQVTDSTGIAQAIKDCQNIHDLANTNLASLGSYGVTAAKLTALQAAIDGFKAIVSKPRDNIAAGKTVTQQLSDEFDAADETLAEILDGLIGQFQATNATFVSDYNNARTIVDASASHASPNQPTPAPTTTTTKPAAPTGSTTK
jgi:flagellar hook-associated protein FlgK